MKKYIIAILLVVVMICAFSTRPSARAEHMSRIRRTVGTYNEANEIQVPPGVVNSVPIMDYTYSYWDGARIASCDECPNAVVCPTCPQFQAARSIEAFGLLDPKNNQALRFDTVPCVTPRKCAGKNRVSIDPEHFHAADVYDSRAAATRHIGLPNATGYTDENLAPILIVPPNSSNPFNPTGAGEAFRIRGAGVMPREPILDSDYETGMYEPGVEHFETSVQPNIIGDNSAFADAHVPYTTSHDYAGCSPMYDLDSGYVSSRERMGACTSRGYAGIGPGRYIARAAGADIDAAQDFARGNFDYVNRAGRCARMPEDKRSMSLLYTDVMGLTNRPPSADECTYIGQNGYIYKERCGKGAGPVC